MASEMTPLPEPMPRSPHINPKTDDHISAMERRADDEVPSKLLPVHTHVECRAARIASCKFDVFRTDVLLCFWKMPCVDGERETHRCRICFEPSSKEVMLKRQIAPKLLHIAFHPARKLLFRDVLHTIAYCLPPDKSTLTYFAHLSGRGADSPVLLQGHAAVRTQVLPIPLAGKHSYLHPLWHLLFV